MPDEGEVYYLAATYPSKAASGSAYTPIERIVHEAELSAYRFFTPADRMWYVIVIGERPPAAIEVKLQTIITRTHGKPIPTLNHGLVQTLLHRRSQQLQKGDWVTRHYPVRGLGE